MFPPPSACGAPPIFEQWRPGQLEALLTAIDTTKPVTGLVLPTGSGKSLVGFCLGSLTNWRIVILTSTRGLQDQIGATFDTAVTDLRGQSNYPCELLKPGGEMASARSGRGTCDEGPCKVGIRCRYRQVGCSYYDAVTKARRARIVVTNYQAWLAQHEYSDGLGPFDCLVLDEAHAIPDELASFLGSTIYWRDLTALGLHNPGADAEIADWIRWAKHAEDWLAPMVEGLTHSASLGTERRAERLLQTVKRLATASPDRWLAEPRQDGTGTEFHILDLTREYPTLVRGAKKVVLTSATLTPKTVAALGIRPEDVEWFEAPSMFPVERRPVIHIPTCRIDFRTDESNTRLWLARIDQILSSRADRKGVIHTGSYARAKLIAEHSSHFRRLILHDKFTTARQIESFRRGGPGAVFVSPSVTTGIDFAFEACEYQIVVKVPWPDRREPIMVARTQADPEYPAYVAMQALVQAVGRGMRSPDDQCETFILDDHVRWFMHQHRAFAPSWFLAAYRSQPTIPVPPPKLAPRL